MEIIVSISDLKRTKNYLETHVNGFLFGSKFSLKYHYSLSEIKSLVDFCHQNKIKAFVMIDAFIFENDLDELEDYIKYLKEIKVDQIIFNDLSIYQIAKEMDIVDLLVFDPDTIMTNSLDASFLDSLNIDVCLAREITYEEIKEIVNNLKNKITLQVFGHTKLSYSKRKFVTNYLNVLKKDLEVENNYNLKIVEEKRDYALEIVEDQYGTRIYSDYVLEMSDEVKEIESDLKRVIVDDLFLEEEVVIDAINSLKGSRINFEEKYPNHQFKKGFLYQKTSSNKDE